MKTTYLGLELSSPVVVGSSPYTANLHNVELCARNGAGAVVLKSIFEEQVMREATSIGATDGYGDSGEYLERYLGEAYKSEFVTLIQRAKAIGIPVIASINCFSLSEKWVEYATTLEQAGASALELNIFLMPTDRHHASAEVEQAYGAIVSRVVEAVSIPVSVKLPMRLTNPLSVCDSLLGHGVKGVVLFNRFFEPDIDVEKLCLVPGDPFSTPSELRNVLRSAALCSSSLPQLDLAVSTGVHDGEAVIKALLCGASATQICTAIHLHGYDVIARMNQFVAEWAERHNFCSLDEFRGWMKFGKAGDEIYQRVQYMKYFPHGVE